MHNPNAALPCTSAQLAQSARGQCLCLACSRCVPGKLRQIYRHVGPAHGRLLLLHFVFICDTWTCPDSCHSPLAQPARLKRTYCDVEAALRGNAGAEPAAGIDLGRQTQPAHSALPVVLLRRDRFRALLSTRHKHISAGSQATGPTCVCS